MLALAVVVGAMPRGLVMTFAGRYPTVSNTPEAGYLPGVQLLHRTSAQHVGDWLNFQPVWRWPKNSGQQMASVLKASCQSGAGTLCYRLISGHKAHGQ